MNEAGELIGIRERTRIEHHENGIAFTEDDGATWTHLDDDTTVSMNMWGFSKSILDEIEKGFPAFLEKGLKENPMKCEYYLPGVVSDLLGENRATVAVLKSADKWYGVTIQRRQTGCYGSNPQDGRRRTVPGLKYVKLAEAIGKC